MLVHNTSLSKIMGMCLMNYTPATKRIKAITLKRGTLNLRLRYYRTKLIKSQYYGTFPKLLGIFYKLIFLLKKSEKSAIVRAKVL